MATLYKTSGIPSTEKGSANGVATLDENGKLPLSQLPTGLGAGTVDSVNNIAPDVNGNVTLTTTNISEGVNLYYTSDRFNTAFTNASSTIVSDISTLQSDVSTKASSASVTSLDGRVTTLEGNVSTLQSDVSTKASSADLTALDGRVTTLESDVSTLESDVLSKASSADLTTLAGRVTTNESNISTLQSQVSSLTGDVDLRALETDLQDEITARTNADLAINASLSDVYSHHLHSNSYYVNDGVNDFHAVLTEIGADQGNVIYASAGSYGGDTLTIENKVNLGIVCPDVGNTICELAGGRGLTISGTSERVRITNLQIEGATTITGTKGRHIFEGVDFLGGLSIDGTTDSTPTFMTFTDCEFSSQNITISNITNCTFYFVRCNFTNVRVIPSNVASPFLIILSECSGLNALQTNLTSGVAIVGRTGYSSGVVKVFSTSSNYISALGVETAFTGSYSELRDKPTLVTASTQLSDSSSLLRTSDKGVANGVAELDADGLIPNHHIPPLALTKPYVVQTIAERDALTGINMGDVAIVVDDPTPANNGNYIYDEDLPSWIALYNSTSPISSVNGQIGAVTLYTGDISEGVGANSEPANLWFTDERALSASVTNDIDDLNKAPNAPTVKTYVEGLTDALDTRLDSVESSILTFATTSYVDNGLNGKVNTTDYTASDVLTKIKTVDGSGSGLDADLLDGLNSSDFVKMTTDQTIAGVKTFSSSPIVPNLSSFDNSTKSANSKYVDDAISSVQANIGASGSLVYKGVYDATANSPSLTTAKKGFFFQVSVSGTLAGVSLTTNDQIVFTADVSGGVVQATDFIVIDNTESGLSNGGLTIAYIGNGGTMQSGIYYLYDGSSNISINVPAFSVNPKIGVVTYLRIRGTGQVTLNASGVAGGEFIVYADSGVSNGVKSVVLTKAGEYKLVCTRRTISGTVYAQWDVTVSNDRALRSTTDLTEGSNLYFTDERAQDASASLFTSGSHTGISYSYVDNSNVINSTVSLASFSIDALSDVDTSTTAPTNGQALAWQSSSSKWIPQTISGGGGSSLTTWGTTVSSNNTVLTLTTSNTAYLVDNSTNAWTVYLPAISACNGMRIIVKRMGTGLVTLSRNASDSSVFIDYAGQTSIDLGVQYSTFELIANTSAGAWYLV